MNNSTGNLLTGASVILILAGLLVYFTKDRLPHTVEGAGQTNENSTQSAPGGNLLPERETTTPPPKSSVPICKKCASGVKLVIRTNSKTKKPFWACPNFRTKNCRYTEVYKGGPLVSGVKTSSSNGFSTSLLINASVVLYHLRQYEDPKFWSYKVHESLKPVMTGSEVHEFDRSQGYNSGPDMILTSKKSDKIKAYEYEYGRNYTYFKISESRYSDLKRYHESTGNPAYWVMSTGGVPLEKGNASVNSSFVPKETFVMQVNQIEPGKRYYINDTFREQYSFLKHIKFVETD
jgi:hypothetical protein